MSFDRNANSPDLIWYHTPILTMKLSSAPYGELAPVVRHKLVKNESLGVFSDKA